MILSSVSFFVCFINLLLQTSNANAFSALTLLVGRQEGHTACKRTEWWGVGMVICLEWGADLHMTQLMPLPLTVSCFSKIQISVAFLVPAHPGSPGQRAVKRVCVCVSLQMSSISYSASCSFVPYTMEEFLPSVFWRCWLGVRKSTQPIKIEWWGVGVVICLERGTDCLHMVQLMPVPPQNPIVPWLISIRTGFTFLVGTGLPRLSWKRGR